MKVVCYYHGNCADGLAAVCAILHKYPSAVTYAMDYGNLPPVYTHADLVFVVDFSFPVVTTQSIIERCDHFVWIDHHEVDDIVGTIRLNNDLGAYGNRKVEILYDKTVSGAYGAWRYILGGDDSKVPQIIRYISDRDIWSFQEPHSKAVSLALGSIPRELSSYQRITSLTGVEEEKLIQGLIGDGRVLKPYHDATITNIIKTTMRMVTIAGQEVPLINCPYTLISDALDRLDENHPFAVGYYDTPTDRTFSIRSRKPDGINVKDIAKSMGGGGHRHAAGWRTALTDPIPT